MAIIEILYICALITNAPFYDCDEKWGIVIADTMTVKDPNGQYVFGFAHWDVRDPVVFHFNGTDHVMPEKYIMVGSTNIDGCYNLVCRSLLHHELLHLICECNWHENMTPKRYLKQA